MHMADALISPAVGGMMIAASTGVMAYSVYRCKDEMEEKKVPLMGVMGAFIFTAQMINFTIPGTGSSGHIGGGLLLASMLGSTPGFLVMATVLIIQALFFADGGILALGCNIFNMGVYSCLIAYPLIFKPMMKKGFSKKRIIIASIIASVIGLQLGAFSVVIETLMSGRTELPFSSFIVLMQPIHLVIGIVEGLITASVLCYIYSIRPEILEGATLGYRLDNINIKKVLSIVIILAIFLGGLLSIFTSKYPDGLEWSIVKVAGVDELEAKGELYDKMAEIQDKTAFMPDYNFKSYKGRESTIGTSSAGIIGGSVTLVSAIFIGFVISKVKKRNNIKTSPK